MNEREKDCERIINFNLACHLEGKKIDKRTWHIHKNM